MNREVAATQNECYGCNDEIAVVAEIDMVHHPYASTRNSNEPEDHD